MDYIGVEILGLENVIEGNNFFGIKGKSLQLFRYKTLINIDICVLRGK